MLTPTVGNRAEAFTPSANVASVSMSVPVHVLAGASEEVVAELLDVLAPPELRELVKVKLAVPEPAPGQTVVYHGTSRSALKSIRTRGVLPSGEDPRYLVGPFVTTSSAIAITYAVQAVARELLRRERLFPQPRTAKAAILALVVREDALAEDLLVDEYAVTGGCRAAAIRATVVVDVAPALSRLSPTGRLVLAS